MLGSNGVEWNLLGAAGNLAGTYGTEKADGHSDTFIRSYRMGQKLLLLDLDQIQILHCLCTS